MTCRHCREFFARYRCSARSHLECDCPRCQGYCTCHQEEKTMPSAAQAAATAEGYWIEQFKDDPGKFYWKCSTGDAHAPEAVSFIGYDTEEEAWIAACEDAEIDVGADAPATAPGARQEG